MIKVGIKPEQICFFDIETVPLWESFIEMTLKAPQLAEAWSKRHDDEDWSMIGLLPEYSRVVCISVGLVSNNELRLKSYIGEELKILEEFERDLSKLPPRISFCSGHNIKEFDIPFIIKRATIICAKIPHFFEIYGRKPWEMNHILDTLEIWRCGGFKGGTSLEVLAAVFGFPNPKIHTAEKSVHDFFIEDDIVSISEYCEADVFTQANVYCLMTGQSALNLSLK